MDQTGVDNPGHFFDTAYLGSYGLQMDYVNDNPTAPWSKLTTAGWFNSTRFTGDTTQGYNPDFPTIRLVNAALTQFAYDVNPAVNNNNNSAVTGQTQGHAYSAGARSEMTFGEQGYTQLHVGGDFRYLGQVIGEEFLLQGDIVGVNGGVNTIDTGLPHALMIDPGAFFEVVQPVNNVWTMSVGGRVDYVRTSGNPDEVTNFTLTNGATPTAKNMSENNVLYAFYATNKFKLDDHWTLDAGFGEAQRPPTLMERYTQGFVMTIQTGLTRLVGTPSLQPERDWQFDVGLSSNYEGLHTKGRFFQSWIQDYVTYADRSVTEPLFTDARLLRFINTRLATHRLRTGGGASRSPETMPLWKS